MLIALSLSTAPVSANISSYFSGLCTGYGAFICLAGLKRIKNAKTTFELKDITSKENLAAKLMTGQYPEIIEHDYTDQYKEGISEITTSLMAFLIAMIIQQFSQTEI